MPLRLPFRRPASSPGSDPDVIGEDDYAFSRTTIAWRKVNATLRIARHGWRGFTYQASANAVGTLVALAIAYLVGLAGGLVTAEPVAVVSSIAVLAAVVVVTALRLAPKQLLIARASEFLEAEPSRIVEAMKQILTSHGYLASGDDATWDILDGLWSLPEPSERSLRSALADR
jgi:hypothetical protein